MFSFFEITIYLMYVVPLYVANSFPVLLHGKLPLDFGAHLGGKPLFGKGKTILGTLVGIISGSLIGIIGLILFPQVLLIEPNYLALVFLLSLGAILGDLVKSFFKRRFGIKSGEKWVVADQLDFIFGGLILSAFIRSPELWLVVLLLVTTFFVHSFMNWLAYKLNLKPVPW